jgi:hypothetical protein
LHEEALEHRGTPFVCPCREVLDNPGDPAVMAVRQPHYLAAK